MSLTVDKLEYQMQLVIQGSDAIKEHYDFYSIVFEQLPTQKKKSVDDLTKTHSL